MKPQGYGLGVCEDKALSSNFYGNCMTYPDMHRKTMHETPPPWHGVGVKFHIKMSFAKN